MSDLREGQEIPGTAHGLIIEALVLWEAYDEETYASLRDFCDEYGMKDVEKAFYMIAGAVLWASDGYYLSRENKEGSICGMMVNDTMYYLNHAG